MSKCFSLEKTEMGQDNAKFYCKMERKDVLHVAAEKKRSHGSKLQPGRYSVTSCRGWRCPGQAVPPPSLVTLGATTPSPHAAPFLGMPGSLLECLEKPHISPPWQPLTDLNANSWIPFLWPQKMRAAR